MKKGGIREMFFRISAFVVSAIMLIGIIFFPFSSINATNISQTFTIPQKVVESHIHLAKGFRFRSRPFRTYRPRPRYRAPRIRPPRIRPPKIRVPRARTPSIKRRFNTRSGIKNKGLFRRNQFKPIRRALSKNLGYGRKIVHRVIPKKLFRQALKRKNRRQTFRQKARQYAKAKWTRARSKLKNSIKSSRNLFVASVGLRRFMRPQKPVRLAGLKRAMTARIKTAKLLLPKHRLRINNKRSIKLLKPSIRSRIISKSLFKGKTKTGFWKRTFTSNKKNNLNRKSAKAELFANKTVRNSKLNFTYNKIRRSKTALAVNKKPGFWSRFWGKKTNKIANTKSQKTKLVNENQKVLAKKNIKKNVIQKKLADKNAEIKTTKLNNKKFKKEQAAISRKQVAVKDSPKLLKEARGPPKKVAHKNVLPKKTGLLQNNSPKGVVNTDQRLISARLLQANVSKLNNVAKQYYKDLRKQNVAAIDAYNLARKRNMANLPYDARVYKRMQEDPGGHEFPNSINKYIFASPPVIIKGGGLGYAVQGMKNGKPVVFNAIVRGGVIVHRDFVSVKNWGRRKRNFGWPGSLEDVPTGIVNIP